MATTHTTLRGAGRSRRLVLSASLGVAALLLTLYLGISAYAVSVLTLPRRSALDVTPASAGLTFRDVSFPARGGDVTLAGWYIPRQGASRAVVLVHGKDSNRAIEFGGKFVDLAAGLRQRGFAVLMIDLRGHGASGDGRFSFGLDERRDVIGAVDWLKTQGFQAGSVGVLGISMGAAAGIGAAADDPDIGALVSDCSYAEIYPLMELHWTEASHLPTIFLPSTLMMGDLMLGQDVTGARPVGEIGLIAPRPVLIIHGAADTFIPVEHGRQLAAADQSAEYWEVPGAPHAGSYLADPAAYTERVASFFEASLK